MKALYTLPQSVGIAGGRPSSSYYFVGSQADNLSYLDPHHTRATVPLRPPTQTQTQTPTTERERDSGIPIRQATPERGSVSPPPPGHRRSPTSPASSRIGRLHSHTQQLRHHLYQNNCPRVALLPEAHMHVGTPLARTRMRMEAVGGRYCWVRLLAILGWMRRRCITCRRIALRS